jgi:ribonuclease P protein component
MTRKSLRPADRIRGDARFEEIRRHGLRAGDDLLFVRALGNDRGSARLGVAVGRSAGGSVLRSRLRRMLREAFRLNRGRIPPGLDLLVSPRRGAPGAGLGELGESLVRLAGGIAGRLASRAEERGRDR